MSSPHPTSHTKSHKPFRLAINGYGRIGRCFLRALHESPLRDQLQVVAINEPADLESIAYLTSFDSTHGRFPGIVELREQNLRINGTTIMVNHETTPEAVNWRGLGVDLLIECSGQYSTRAELERFIEAGVPRLLLSHPANSAADVDATIVYGINHESLYGNEVIVSNASCTTNAVVPVLDLLNREFGIEHALLTTLHSVMNDQPLADGYHHTDLRRTRSAMQSIIPVSTGLARGVERLLPSLIGRVEAKAIRVPTMNVSAIDIVVEVSQKTNQQHPMRIDEINALLAATCTGQWHRLLDYTAAPHASIDFNHDPHSAIIDGSQTRLAGPRMLNLMLWFDNEWGFANRLLDVAGHWRQRLT